MRWADVYNRAPTVLRVPLLFGAGLAGYVGDVRRACAVRERHRPDPTGLDSEDYREAVNVGTCGACLGAVLYSHRARLASCPCGATVIPRALLEPSLRPKSAPP